jgi:hypothetical protein
MSRTKTLNPTRDSNPIKKEASPSRKAVAKAEPHRRPKSNRAEAGQKSKAEAVQKSPAPSPERGGKNRPWLQMLQHPLMGLLLRFICYILPVTSRDWW